MPIKLILAPIRGITTAEFRRIYIKHFTGLDSAMAPFIPTTKGKKVAISHLKDILIENNIKKLPLTPQLISKNGEDFVAMANRIYPMGYKTINWNLGCPSPTIVNKQRGSGMLPYPDKIKEFLDIVIPGISGKLSIKIRLGFLSPDEIFKIIPILNQYPIADLTIHLRTGKQMYNGEIDLERFKQCLKLSKIPVVYNGDITNLEFFRMLLRKFPKVNSWMIGRGVLRNPFLPEQIKKIGTDNCFSETSDTLGFSKQSQNNLGIDCSNSNHSDSDSLSLSLLSLDKIKVFHDELFEEYRNVLFGEAHLLGRMKELWAYLAFYFDSYTNSYNNTYNNDNTNTNNKVLKKILKVNSVSRYMEIVARAFLDYTKDIKDNIR